MVELPPPNFSSLVCPQFFDFNSYTHLYHTLRRVYSTTILSNIKTHSQPWRMRRKLHQTTQSLPSPPSSASPQSYICLTKGKAKKGYQQVKCLQLGPPQLRPPPSKFLCRPAAQCCQTNVASSSSEDAANGDDTNKTPGNSTEKCLQNS